MTPTGFLLQHLEIVQEEANDCPVSETWRKLVDRINIDKTMSENTFRVVIKPFIETCQFYNDGLNEKLNETITMLNTELNNEQELNKKLNTEIEELNKKLNTLDGLNEKLNTTDMPVKTSINISGWTVTKQDKYFRAFKKIQGKVYGVHLGKNLDDAAAKIEAKEGQLRLLTHTVALPNR